MIEELIRQLKNPDPDVRKRAIMALGKAKDPAALKALAEVVRGDPDPTLRELALKAGQYIRQQTKKSTRGPQDKDLPTTGMLIRKSPAKAEPTPPPPPPLRRSERKALAANPPPPPPKKVVRRLEDTGELPETGALLGKSKPAAPKAPSSLLSNLNDKSAPPKPPPAAPRNTSVSPFTSASDSDDESNYPSYLSDDEPRIPLYDDQDDDLDFLPDLGDDAPPKSARKAIYEPNILPDLGDDAPIEPLRAPPLYVEKEAPAKPEEPQPFIKGSSIVKGRKYNVSKDDETRARGYVNAALSMNLEGDNAKAMKNLTQAIVMNPNLINDGFFSNVAATVTGLEGDAAAQMIIDGKERKRFTEAKQSTGADVGVGLFFYGLISTFGPLFAVLVEQTMVNNLLDSFSKNRSQLPAQLQNAQIALGHIAAISPLPVAIVSGISSVLTLLLQTVIIHFLAKMLGGVGTWSHLLNVLVSFYNKWYLILYIVLAGTLAIAFLSLFSPILLCFLLVVIILSLYVLVQTFGKVGVAYDFGAAKGFVTVLLSGIIILLINAAINYVLFQSLGLKLS